MWNKFEEEALDKAGIAVDQAVIISTGEYEGEKHEGEVQSAREDVHYQHVDKESGKMTDDRRISRYLNVTFNIFLSFKLCDSILETLKFIIEYPTF